MVVAAVRLSPRVQSNIGLIRAGINRGLTSTQIQSLIKATGQPGLRRTDLLSGMRYAKGIQEAGFRIRSVTLDRFPDPSRIPVAKGRILRNFSYEVRFSAIDRRTGLRKDHFLTVRSDKNLTPRQIQTEAQRALDEAPLESETDQFSEGREFTVVGAVRRG